MNRRDAIGAVLFSAALFAPAHTKKPEVADEAEVRGIVASVYEGYTTFGSDMTLKEIEAVDDGPDAYKPPYTQSLGALVARWDRVMMATDELYSMNSFDWYCQCQDFDNETAEITRQSYKSAGKDRIDANILFSTGWVEQGYAGAPLLFRFKREGGKWKLDDLKFDGGGMLRKDLADDLKDATRDQAKALP